MALQALYAILNKLVKRLMSYVSETAYVNNLEDTIREDFDISKVEVPSLSDEECDAIDDKFRCPGNCHPSCGFGSDDMDGNHKIFKCIKCSSMPGGDLYASHVLMVGVMLHIIANISNYWIYNHLYLTLFGS